MRKRISAFGLMETSVALLILGSLSRLGIASVKVSNQIQRNKITEYHAEIILKSLAAYVKRCGVLPYPSLPSMDGASFESPNNEKDWIYRPEKYMSGIIPYQNLGIPKKYAMDGWGSYFSYNVNVMLCKRKEVQSLSVTDPRNALDHYQHKTSTFTSVRCYDRFLIKCEADEEYPYYIINGNKVNSDVVAWDMINFFDNTKLYLFENGISIYEPTSYEIIPPVPYVRTFEANAAASHQLSPFFNKMEPRDQMHTVKQFVNAKTLSTKRFYTVHDTIALVLISHGASRQGSIQSNDKRLPVEENASRGKKINAQNYSDKTQMKKFYTSSNDRGLFDDKVYWISRFNLLSIYANFPFSTYEVIGREYGSKKPAINLPLSRPNLTTKHTDTNSSVPISTMQKTSEEKIYEKSN